MSTHGDGGKGSARRNEDVSKINENWDRIFGGNKKQNKKEQQTMNDEYEHDDETEDTGEYDDDGGRICPVCRGDMVVTGTGMYLFCDTCGHREELENDDY
jgi:hypothetical protein